MAAPKKKPAAPKKTEAAPKKKEKAPAPKAAAVAQAAAPARAAGPKPKGLAAALEAAVIPSDAAGLGRAKGLGASAHLEALLGLGFPYLIVPTDGEVGTFETCGAFARAYAHDANVMPRAAVVQQYVIAVPETPATPFRTAADPLPPLRKIALPEAVKRALAYHDGRKIQQLEVMFGSKAVADEMVSQLSKLPVAKWNADRGIAACISAGLRWLQWRVPAADRARLRGTLEETWLRIRSATGGRNPRALDVMLHGRMGVERSGSSFAGKLHLGDLVSAEDDPQWALEKALAVIKTLRPQDRERFDPQLVVLCGKKLLKAFRENVDKLLVEQRKTTIERLALFA